jgi:hypothetical protein
MNRLGLLGIALVLFGAACGGGSYSQEDLDAAVSDAVSAALATTSSTTAGESATTTKPADTTTTSEAEATTTTVVTATTTTEARDLDESDPRNADAVSGNEAPPLERGEEGILSVITGNWNSTAYGSTYVYLVVRNNTGEEVKDVEVAFTIRDGSGTLLASGNTSDMYPYRVDAGGITFGSAFLSDTELPPDAQFEFQLTSSDRAEKYESRLNLVVIEHGHPGDKLIGIIENPSSTSVHLAQVGAMCFAEDGEVLWFDDSFAEADSIDSGGTSPVSIDLRENECPIYLMAAKAFEE